MIELAAAPPWLILVLWGFILLVRGVGKKKAPPRQPLARGTGADDSRVELGDAFQRAMEKLKQAERESQAGRRPAPVAARAPTRQSYRLVLEDHSAQSQESEPEAVDYDEAAARLEEARVREEAEAFERVDAPAAPRVLSSASVQPAVHARAPHKVLSRFADGSLRGAVVLSEILGRPIADR